MSELVWHKEGMGGEVNIVIGLDGLQPDDINVISTLIFCNESLNWLPRTTTMLDILVATGIFPSKGEARRNWKGPIEVPEGFSFDQFTKLGKFKKSIYILKIPSNYFEALKKWEDEDSESVGR